MAVAFVGTGFRVTLVAAVGPFFSVVGFAKGLKE